MTDKGTYITKLKGIFLLVLYGTLKKVKKNIYKPFITVSKFEDKLFIILEDLFVFIINEVELIVLYKHIQSQFFSSK